MTFKEFNLTFPNEKSCLDYVFCFRFPGGCPRCSKKMYPIKGRKAYSCSSGHQVSPLAGTPFYKSSTPLRSWFYAIQLLTTSKNGLSSQELARHIGVGYKTAWRMGMIIRSGMEQRRKPLRGVVEMDEAYIGGKGKTRGYPKDKVAVVGMLERGGEVRAVAVEDTMRMTMIELLYDHVERGTLIMTDEYTSYQKIESWGYPHKWVNHSRHGYVDGDIHTNGIEGFWSQLKRSLSGTHHAVSRKHLQSYLDYFVFQHNHRDDPFRSLVSSFLIAHGEPRRTSPVS